MEKSEEHNARCGGATGVGTTAEDGGRPVETIERAIAAMAMAVANLMGPTEAAPLNEAAAILMEGVDDGDA